MPQPEPEPGPAEQHAVRRLLADARHTGPVPPDVATRLDDVLAVLLAEDVASAEPAPAPPAAPVDVLAARRRRLVTRLLGAAAVVVLGLGVSQVAGLGGESASEKSSADSDAAAGGALGAPDAPREESAAQAPVEAPAPVEAEPQGGGVDGSTEVLTVDPGDFERSVRSLRDAPSWTSDGREPLDDTALTAAPMFVCPLTEFGPGRLVAVSYAGQPAVLAFRSPVGQTQSVELVQCGSGVVLRSVVLTFP